jgi:geranylgeranyl diphosphate synthase type II
MIFPLTREFKITLMYNSYIQYKSRIDTAIAEFLSKETLYEPVKYAMSSGGKRIRPVIVLVACEACGGNSEDAIDTSVAVELLHNFTLVHDDIMDNASSRRGIETVHKKWDVNTAILAGDELIALSYKSLLRTKTGRIAEIARTFTEGIMEVCEGQAMDKEFEKKTDVTLDDYLLMIGRKTAAMIKMSAKLGAMIANGGFEKVELLGHFGEAIGMAFQIQDDLLDVSSTEARFGKKIGGDIVEHKKTYLYLKALELSPDGKRKDLMNLFESHDSAEKVSKVIKEFENLRAVEAAKNEVKAYTDKAAGYLDGIGNGRSREMFAWLADMLLNRES